MIERTPVTGYDEVWLGGMPFRVTGNVNWELTNIFARPINQGAPGPNDHPNHSTSIQNDWSGGALVKYMNPASDIGRFRFATLETQYPGSFSLPPITDEYTSPNAELGTPWVVGDYQDRLYVAWGNTLYYRNANDGGWILVGDLPNAVSGKGTVYREFSDNSSKRTMLFVPIINSYVVVAPDNTWVQGVDELGVVEDDMGAIEFAVWDEKVFQLKADGSLWWATREPSLEGDWQYVTHIPDGTTPRRLVPYLDKSNNPCLMVVTDATTWKLDFANNILHQDDLLFPRHPHQGRAAINHLGALHVSAGTGIYRYDNNTIAPVGLDSRHGLPPEFRGFIRDFASTSTSGLYALLQGEVIIPTNGQETATLNLGGGDDQLYLTNYRTNNLLMVHNGFGWHYRWTGVGTAPTNIHVSTVQNTYAIWWGAGSVLYKQDIQRVHFNPGDFETRGYRFAKRGYLETSWNDWNWTDQDKIGKAIETKIKHMTPGCEVSVYYKMDDEDSDWNLLGNITTDGEYRFYLGQDRYEPNLRNNEPFVAFKGKTHGVRHKRYSLKFELVRGEEEDSSPVVEWYAVVARRWMRPQRVWSMVIDLSEKHKDHTQQELFEHLMSLAIQQEAILFQHRDEQHMVELTLSRGPQLTGEDKSTMVNVTLLESNDLDWTGDRTQFNSGIVS
jgi:hypothetical protein